MNRQIRRLGVALLVCSRCCSCSSTAAGREGRRLQRRPRQQPRGRARLHPAAGSIVTADGVVVAEACPPTTQYDYRRVYPRATCSPGHRVLLVPVRHRGRGAQYNDELAGQTDAQKLSGLADLFDDRANVGDVMLSVRSRRPDRRRSRPGRPRRLGGGPRPPHRRRAGAVLEPDLRPQRPRQPRHRRRVAAREALLADPPTPCWRAPTRSGSSRARRSRSSPPRPGSSPASSPPEPVYPATATRRPGTHRPDQNFNGGSCGGALIEIIQRSCNTAFAQMGVDLGPQIMVAGPRRTASTTPRPSTCPRPAQSFFPPVQAFPDDTPKLAQSASARTTCRPPRCRWRWWPPRSPTAA